MKTADPNERIVVKPAGGLCNRLRTIDSALLLARQFHRPLHILWTLGPELNCSYDRLFEPRPDVYVIEYESRPIRNKLLAKLAARWNRWLCGRRYQRVIFQGEMNRLLRNNADLLELERYASIFINCCNRFYRPQRKLLPFEPTAEIRQQVEASTAAFGESTIGVHIRRTDHQTATACSSEQGFIDAMNAQLQQAPDTKFFLASDSPEVLSRFLSLFGDRVAWYPKQYDRNSPEGIRDAMVDLLCLSRTKKIIGSRLSSFSETAAQISDIELLTVGENA